jgi:peptidoglycan/LPS O-acetylase OafA/YrhL
MGVRERRRFDGFDGLRACAALLVLAYHVSLASGFTRAGALAPLAASLKGGVTVFFVISGFLLYVPYARAIRGASALPAWRHYARRRALRILPAYWTVLTVLAFGPLAHHVTAVEWWRYYGLTQTYNARTMFGGLGAAWSLCVEVSFYGVLPILARGLAALVARRRGARANPVRMQLVPIAAIAFVSLALRVALAASLLRAVPPAGLVLATTLPGMLDWFAIGIALAVLAAEWELDPARLPRIAGLASHPGRCWLGAACCYLAGAALQGGDLFLPLYGLGTHVAFGLAAGLLVLPAVRGAPGMGMLRSPLATWLGTVSYGIYLWHVPVLGALQGWGTPPPIHAASALHALGLLAAVAAGAIGLGAASWYLVERPAQRWGARRERASQVPRDTAPGPQTGNPDAFMARY